MHGSFYMEASIGLSLPCLGALNFNFILDVCILGRPFVMLFYLFKGRDKFSFHRVFFFFFFFQFDLNLLAVFFNQMMLHR